MQGLSGHGPEPRESLAARPGVTVGASDMTADAATSSQAETASLQAAQSGGEVGRSEAANQRQRAAEQAGRAGHAHEASGREAEPNEADESMGVSLGRCVSSRAQVAGQADVRGGQLREFGGRDWCEQDGRREAAGATKGDIPMEPVEDVHVRLGQDGVSEGGWRGISGGGREQEARSWWSDVRGERVDRPGVGIHNGDENALDGTFGFGEADNQEGPATGRSGSDERGGVRAHTGRERGQETGKRRRDSSSDLSGDDGERRRAAVATGAGRGETCKRLRAGTGLERQSSRPRKRALGGSGM